MKCVKDLDISRRLRNLRDGKGKVEMEISTALDISPAHYCRLEQGKSKITVDVLQKACAYYDVTAEYILFGIRKESSPLVEKLKDFPEETVRRMLKMLSCLLKLDVKPNQQEDANYKIFIGGLLELTPVNAASAIPTVLEYEKNRRDVSENTMIKELEISRFIWSSIMKGDPIKNVEIPLKIQEKYGYDLDFLINNRVRSNMFFEKILARETRERQKKILQMFYDIVNMQEKEL